MKVLLRTQIDAGLVMLQQRVEHFTRQIADVMQVEILGREEQFRFFRRLLNFDEWRIDGRPKSTQYLDFQVVNSDIEAERDHLRVGDHFVRVLTMRRQFPRPGPWSSTSSSKSRGISTWSRNGRRFLRRRRARR